MKKHFSSFSKGSQSAKIVSDLRVRIQEGKEIPNLYYSNKTRFDLKSIHGIETIIAQ